MARNGGNTVPSITNAEHIGPDSTGDNIEAKRVALYAWDSATSQWIRNVRASTPLSGTGTDTTLTLTSAATSYQVPASAPTSPYMLMLYNGSDTDMYVTFTSTTTGGIKLAAGTTLNIDLGTSQTLYAYCSSAGKILNVSYKVI